MATSYPVKYMMYTHFGFKETEDFEAWCAGTPPAELQGVRHIIDHLASLQELLTSPAYEGILVVFYSSGFAACLDGIALGKSRRELLSDSRVRFASEVGEFLATQRQGDMEFRLRFVTPIDLYDIFGRMNWTIAQDLRWWFIGKGTAIRYDAPKIVEAIVRLRLLGTGVPVFRVDYDVIFRGEENNRLSDLGLFKAVALCLRAYRLRVDEPSVATFMFSASYDTRDLFENDGNFASWSRAFATRIYPCLPVITDEVQKIGTQQRSAEYTWDTYAQTVFDRDLARRFYGLSESSLTSDGISGIGKFGAHPTASVISGALLCFSEGAIIDLPPFSNFTLNVSWIDDHLKYSLHRELRHLTTVELKIEPLLSDAKLDTVMVQKMRARITDLPSYVLGSYLPTLLWGTVVDAWINPDPLLKYRPEDLSPDGQAAWHSIKRNGQSDGVLASALQTALGKGSFIMAERIALKEKLIAVGLSRISEVRRAWSELTHDGKETFASIWAKGTVASHFAGLNGKCQGIADPNIPIQADVTEVVNLNHYLHDDFLMLVEDALEYIEWALNWPKIVQVVRSVEQGTIRTDMSWHSEKPSVSSGAYPKERTIAVSTPAHTPSARRNRDRRVWEKAEDGAPQAHARGGSATKAAGITKRRRNKRGTAPE